MNKNISCISPSVSPKSEEMIIVGFAYRTSAAAVTTPVSIHCVQGLLLVLLIFRLSQGSWVPLNISLDSYTFSCSEVDSPLSKEKLFVAIGIFRSKLTQTQWPEYHPQKPTQHNLEETPHLWSCFWDLMALSSQTVQVVELRTWSQNLVSRRKLIICLNGQWIMQNNSCRSLGFWHMTDRKCHLHFLIYIEKAQYKIIAERFVFLSASSNWMAF